MCTEFLLQAKAAAELLLERRFSRLLSPSAALRGTLPSWWGPPPSALRSTGEKTNCAVRRGPCSSISSGAWAYPYRTSNVQHSLIKYAICIFPLAEVYAVYFISALSVLCSNGRFPELCMLAHCWYDRVRNPLFFISCISRGTIREGSGKPLPWPFGPHVVG